MITFARSSIFPLIFIRFMLFSICSVPGSERTHLDDSSSDSEGDSLLVGPSNRSMPTPNYQPQLDGVQGSGSSSGDARQPYENHLRLDAIGAAYSQQLHGLPPIYDGSLTHDRGYHHL
jgi:hypothetical protein